MMKVMFALGLLVTLTFAMSSNVAGAPVEENNHMNEKVSSESPLEDEKDSMGNSALKDKDDSTDESTLENETEEPPVTQSPEEKRCSDMIGLYWDDKWEGLEVSYDVKEVLEKYGGPPGKVNATWTEKDSPPVGNATDERPLPIADEEYWIYSYTDSDLKTWARGEHAVRRFKGTPKEFLEIRGVMLWAPEDFCGRLRRAYYTVDDRGFTFEVTREYCWVGSGTYSCAWPGHCHHTDDGGSACVAGPSVGLLAALVGGG